MTHLEHYIHSYFEIPTTSLGQIAGMFKEEQLDKGDYFSKQDGHCKRLSFVDSGLVRMYVNVDGKEVTQWISQQGYFITDLASFMFNESGRWNIQALTEVRIFSIYQSDYQQIADHVPEWHELEKRFLARCFTTLEERVFTHLSMTAEERYLQFFESNKALFNEVPLQYIASMLGMTPETFSRVRKKLSPNS